MNRTRPLPTILSLASLVFITGATPLRAQYLPNTEQGNVILRDLDFATIPAIETTYVGHIGIFGGWDGNNHINPVDFFIFDTQRISETSPTFSEIISLLGVYEDSTVKRRTFQQFTSINTFVAGPLPDYDGGHTLVASAGSVGNLQRQEISDIAASFVGADITVKLFFGFLKNPSAQEYRCDGFVEHVYELAGVRGGIGVVPTDAEILIVTPAAYAQAPTLMTIESGQGPEITDVQTTYSGGEIHVAGQAADTPIATQSGVKKVEIGYISEASLFVQLGVDDVGATGVKNFDISAPVSSFPENISEGTIRAFDRAGNDTSVSFNIADPLFLVGGRKLIFSESAIQNAENQGIPGFYQWGPEGPDFGPSQRRRAYIGRDSGPRGIG